MWLRTDVKVGCCGFAWAPGDYFQNLPAVEIQQSFYRLPRPETVMQWRRQVPEGAIFSLRAWQLITHYASSPGFRLREDGYRPQVLERCGGFQDTDEVWTAWEALRNLAGLLRARYVVFQSPADFDPSVTHIERLNAFFGRIDRGRLRLAWAPPDGWPPKLIGQLCRRHRLLHCTDPFQVPAQSPGPVYYRLQGLSSYRHRYTDDELGQLRGFCRRKRGLVFFNTYHMREDACRFARLMGT